ncbi:MAG TPA: choice-of-anchor tandem repeat GloVer-containing protein [Terriglobales bacterium]|nr:choice-of-anchor tandem repeat GloVer-containing protein [Terriglobales bacterium]
MYGTTAFGGTSDNGTIFKIDHGSGKITVLHRFISVDGVSPHAGLIRDSEGNSYGTTDHGGDTNCNPPNGCGTVFKLNRTGKLIVLHTFTGPDGDSPGHATLLRDSSGALYGTAVGGGPGGGGGVVFKLDPDGAETVLHTFSERADGNGPSAGLVRDVDGNLYGTTVNGGIFNDTTCQVVGCGVVFELSPTSSGWKETVLYRFTGGSDGGYPQSALVLDQHGNLYGTTTVGGNFAGQNCTGAGCGTIFKLQLSSGGWTETVLYAFSDGLDGQFPWAGLVRDAAGNLFGSAVFGGDLNCNSPQGCGAIFNLDTSRKLTVLHTFTGTDGELPVADLLFDRSAHLLYGTASYGGDLHCKGLFGPGCGSVFKLALRK